jgi:hypothetical protein
MLRSFPPASLQAPDRPDLARAGKRVGRPNVAATRTPEWWSYAGIDAVRVRPSAAVGW